jgi:hypothetical protein
MADEEVEENPNPKGGGSLARASTYGRIFSGGSREAAGGQAESTGPSGKFVKDEFRNSLFGFDEQE